MELIPLSAQKKKDKGRRIDSQHSSLYCLHTDTGSNTEKGSTVAITAQIQPAIKSETSQTESQGLDSSKKA